MLNYIGNPAGTRDASVEFSSRGLLYKKLPAISAFSFFVLGVAGHFYSAAFLCFLPFVFHSIYSKGPVVVTEQKIPTNTWPTLPTGRFNIIYSLDKTLTTTQIAQWHLEKVLINVLHPYAYVRKGIEPSAALALYKEMKAAGFTPNIDTGLKGKGISLRSLSTYQLLSRIVMAFVTLPKWHDLDVTPEQDWGYAYCHLKSTGQSTDAPVFKPYENKANPSRVLMNDAEIKRLGGKDGTQEAVVEVTATRTGGIYKLSEAAEEDSHLFAFLPWTLPFDTTFITHMIVDHFVCLLGNTSDDQVSGLSNLESGLKGLSGTYEGQVLVFAFLMVSLAIKARAPLYLFYSGDKLLGAQIESNLEICAFGRVLASTDSSAVQTTLSTLMTTENARDRIAIVLSELNLVGQAVKATVYGFQIDTFAKCVAKISERERMSEAQVKTISTYIPYANDGFEVESATIDNLTAMVQHIFAGNTSTMGTLSEGLFTDSNLVLSSNLSRFGPLSVSFMNIGGRRKDLYKTESKDPNATKTTKRLRKAKGQKAKGGQQKVIEVEVPYWEFLRVSRTSISLAIQDWKTMVAGGFLLQLETDDGKQLGSVDTHPFPASSALLSALRAFGKDHEEERKAKKQKVEAAPVIGEPAEAEEEELDF